MDREDLVPGDTVNLDAYRLMKTNTMIHAELRALLGYWEGLRAGRKTPYRNEIDPRDMTGDARNLFILENLGRGNIRFRLAGTAIVDAFGMELRGMNARAIMAPQSRESLSALISETLEDPGVGYARLRDHAESGAVWELLLLPLRSDFGMIDRVIGCLVPLKASKPGFDGMPLRFEIEQMAVEPIDVTVRDLDSPTPLPGFGEKSEPFKGGPRRRPQLANAEHDKPRKTRLVSIEGGRDTDTDSDDASDRPRGHLRLVKD